MYALFLNEAQDMKVMSVFTLPSAGDVCLTPGRHLFFDHKDSKVLVSSFHFSPFLVIFSPLLLLSDYLLK